MQGSIVVGIDYDCRERMVYWTDVAGRTISRASLEPGAEPETIISSGQHFPGARFLSHWVLQRPGNLALTLGGGGLGRSS